VKFYARDFEQFGYKPNTFGIASPWEVGYEKKWYSGKHKLGGTNARGGASARAAAAAARARAGNVG